MFLRSHSLTEHKSSGLFSQGGVTSLFPYSSAFSSFSLLLQDKSQSQRPLSRGYLRPHIPAHLTLGAPPLTREIQKIGCCKPVHIRFSSLSKPVFHTALKQLN